MSESSTSQSSVRAIVDPEYANLVPAISEADYRALVESIRLNGLLQPIVVNKNGVVLDGHNRLRACLETGTRPKYIAKELPTREEERLYAIETNVLRRHLTPFVRCELALKLEPLEKEKARIRRLSTLKNVKNALASTPNSLVHEDEHGDIVIHGETLEILSRKAGTSPELLRQAKRLLEKASDDVLSQLRRGEISISGAFQKLDGQEQSAAALAAAPQSSAESSVDDAQQSLKQTTKRARIIVLPDSLYDNAVDAILQARSLGASKIELEIEHKKVVLFRTPLKQKK